MSIKTHMLMLCVLKTTRKEVSIMKKKNMFIVVVLIIVAIFVLFALLIYQILFVVKHQDDFPVEFQINSMSLNELPISTINYIKKYKNYQKIILTDSQIKDIEAHPNQYCELVVNYRSTHCNEGQMIYDYQFFLVPNIDLVQNVVAYNIEDTTVDNDELGYRENVNFEQHILLYRNQLDDNKLYGLIYKMHTKIRYVFSEDNIAIPIKQTINWSNKNLHSKVKNEPYKFIDALKYVVSGYNVFKSVSYHPFTSIEEINKAYEKEYW